MAINTYWDITLGVILRKGNITKDCVKDFELQSDADPILSFTWNTTSTHNAHFSGEEYACHI